MTTRNMHRDDALRMIKARAKAVGLPDDICKHTFWATGFTAHLENGGAIEHVQRIANTNSRKPPNSTTALTTRSRSMKLSGL